MADRVEYDVLVNLKLGAGKGGLGLGKAAARETGAASREIKRFESASLSAFESSRRRREAAEKAAAKRSAQIEKARQRELEQARRASAKWWGDARGGAAGASGGLVGGVAGAFQSVGTGPAVQWAKSAALAAGLVFAAGFGAAASYGLVGGVGENAKAESTGNRIGTTLQLFDFNAGIEGSGQYTKNLQDAAWYQQELIRIADSSPGDVEQVEGLFQNLLPGMASITQDAERITDLTQKATLLSAVLGNRFELVGEQASRALTGGAGAEMDTWRLLQKPILEAGKAMGVFKDSQGLGESLTMAFNKLDPQARLAVFEKGLSKLGDEVAEQYSNSWEGITAQALSAGKTLRRVLGADTFNSLKSGLKSLTQDGGPLDSKGGQFAALKEFMAFTGSGAGAVVEKALGLAKNATSYVADNWQTIVQNAQIAAHYLVSGAKTAVGIMSGRAVAGAALGVAGGAMSVGKGAVSSLAGLASLGTAALVAGPALLAVTPLIVGLGIAAAGVGVLFGGLITYVTSKFDDFVSALRDGSVNIQPFLTAIDDLGAKMFALGGSLLGSSDSSSNFQTWVDLATGAVRGVTDAFSWLLRTTADVLDAFGTAANFLRSLDPRNKNPEWIEAGMEKMRSLGMEDTPEYLELKADLESAKAEGSIGDSIHAAAAAIRRGADAFDGATADPFNADLPSLSEAVYNRIYPMGPQPAPAKTKDPRGNPPTVKANVTLYNTMNLREADPNAVVAAFNRTTAGKLAVPLSSALQRARILQP